MNDLLFPRFRPHGCRKAAQRERYRGTVRKGQRQGLRRKRLFCFSYVYLCMSRYSWGRLDPSGYFDDSAVGLHSLQELAVPVATGDRVGAVGSGRKVAICLCTGSHRIRCAP